MTKLPDPIDWPNALAGFPEKVRPTLEKVRRNHGGLPAATVAQLLEALGGSLESLMLRLLPLAKCYSVMPISHFQVGAIAADRAAKPRLYFGANFEFARGALGFSVHAEQSAINNAWLHGAGALAKIAVTAPPCGHCRQFINELAPGEQPRVFWPGNERPDEPTHSGTDLLPRPFGPGDLDKAPLSLGARHALPDLRIASQDSLALKALDAARRSHAPYSGAWCGCAIETTDGTVQTGRSAENAAFNPTLPAVASAISALVLHAGPGVLGEIKRVALVETPTKASQRAASEAMLSAAPLRVPLEYHEARQA